MKTLFSFALLAILLLTAASAGADIVGATPQGEYIHRYIADNGQEIYYVSREDEWAVVKKEDVNFDGQDDLVFLITLGASNDFVEFYVRCGEEYVLAGRNAIHETGLPNYTLHPDEKLVSTSVSNGWAGLLHEKHIFRWEGPDLRLVRYAVSEQQKTAVFDGDLFVTIENGDLVHTRVYEARYGEGEREDVLLFEQVSSVSAGFDEQALLKAEADALWQGLR